MDFIITVKTYNYITTSLHRTSPFSGTTPDLQTHSVYVNNLGVVGDTDINLGDFSMNVNLFQNSHSGIRIS